MLETTHEKEDHQKYKCPNSEKIYLTYCPEDKTTDLNNAMEVLKKRYFGAFEIQEKKISKQFEEIFESTKKVDHLVNNVSCKNARINSQLQPVIQNMFVIYQREIIE
jgi:septation ring formation regulator EzrA